VQLYIYTTHATLLQFHKNNLCATMMQILYNNIYNVMLTLHFIHPWWWIMFIYVATHLQLWVQWEHIMRWNYIGTQWQLICAHCKTHLWLQVHHMVITLKLKLWMFIVEWLSNNFFLSSLLSHSYFVIGPRTIGNLTTRLSKS
jgi:hypothetical protein